MIKKYAGIVIGAGHAGMESCFALANAKLNVLLITLNKDSIASCPCNPSIGGPAKGIVTREIDALGGMQAIACDNNSLQIKILNESRGASVQALRAQIDKISYHNWFTKQIKNNKYIDLLIDEVIDLIVKNKTIVGIKTPTKIIYAKTVIITSGTYMNAKTHIGLENKIQGPCYDIIENKKHQTYWSTLSSQLSNNLKKHGFEIIRLKTGTPPRIYKESINYKKIEKQPGSKEHLCFNHFKDMYLKDQAMCWMTHTNKKTHDIIKKNIKLSAMYSGNIKGVGPRYCPSIEDKVMRFSDKPRHQLFIEPESLLLDTMYLQGLSSSLPANIQEQFVHSIVGLEKAKFQRYAYAIEYDAINPQQLYHTLESKKIKNLFFAGQVNGTSGYEEAAGQGLIAGINAICVCKNKKQIILNREESYIGVMIDDITTKGVTDPYRLLTSRAENRLYIRNDNVLDRLIKYGKYVGLIDKQKYNIFLKIKKNVETTIEYIKKTPLTKQLLKKYGNYHNLYSLLKRPEVELKDILNSKLLIKLNNNEIRKITIEVKYAGYLEHNKKLMNENIHLKNISLKSITDYKKIKNLSLEAIDKLNKYRPDNLFVAQKISGINTNDILIIKHHIETKK